jgi:RNA polymerase sigma factor for flagellar operon FliA
VDGGREEGGVNLEKHIPTIHAVAHRLNVPKTVDRRDLEQVGFIGLMDARRRFTPRRGVKFSTFARGRIAGAMLDHLRGLDPLSRCHRKAVKAGTAPEVQTLSIHLESSQDGRDMLWERALVSSDPSPLDLAQQSEDRERVAAAVAKLPERWALVLRLYYWEELPMREIGARLGVQEPRVSQIHKAAIERLRGEMGVAA